MTRLAKSRAAGSRMGMCELRESLDAKGFSCFRGKGYTGAGDCCTLCEGKGVVGRLEGSEGVIYLYSVVQDGLRE